MKNSRKTKKMPRFMKTFSDISRIFVLSSAISVSITSILLIINAVIGIFIGFRYYIILALGMIIMLTPCWVLCDCRRIFGRQPRRVIKNKSVRTKRTSRRKEPIRRRKIS